MVANIEKNTTAIDFYDPTAFGHMQQMAETFIKSGAFPSTDNAQKLLVKMQAGREMGMAPLESVKSFYFVNGVFSIYGAATTRRLREHGWTIEFKDEPNKCTATVKRDKEEYTETLTFDEAQKSGWTHQYKRGADGKLMKDANGRAIQTIKPSWYEGINRRLKLRYGVLSIIIKTYIPEVLGSAVDIQEVAVDTAPVMQGEIENPEEQIDTTVIAQVEVPNGEAEASEAQLATIKALGGDVSVTYTKQDAANEISRLAREKGAKK